MHRRNAFTLVELLVVVSVIAVLLAMLIPSLERAMDMTHRATCAARLRSNATGAIAYAQENRADLFIAQGRVVQTGIPTLTSRKFANDGRYNHPDDFSVDWTYAMSTVGLATASPIPVSGGDPDQRSPVDSWVCPTIDTRYWPNLKPVWNSADDIWGIGYQYFGGIEYWRHPVLSGPKIGGAFESASPSKLSTSRGNWALAADVVFKFDGTWLGIHTTRAGGRPEGGNTAALDASVAWQDFYNLSYLHTWSGAPNRQLFFYQTDLGLLSSKADQVTAEYWEFR